MQHILSFEKLEKNLVWQKVAKSIKITFATPCSRATYFSWGFGPDPMPFLSYLLWSQKSL
jgi:hypothetical protein